MPDRVTASTRVELEELEQLAGAMTLSQAFDLWEGDELPASYQSNVDSRLLSSRTVGARALAQHLTLGWGRKTARSAAKAPAGQLMAMTGYRHPVGNPTVVFGRATSRSSPG
jgi:hypothetical protein